MADKGRIVVTVTGQDRVRIVAVITGVLAGNQVDIIESTSTKWAQA